METEFNPTENVEQKIENATHEFEKEGRKIVVKHQGGSGSPVYGLGMIGACVYYIGRATTFQEGMIGFLKGMVWPAFLVYEILVFLHKD